jgi:hypothetical protein
LQVFDPSTFQEDKGKPKWEASMKVEYDVLIKNETWVLSMLPPVNKSIGCQCNFEIKYKLDDSLDKYKVHLVTKGHA